MRNESYSVLESATRLSLHPKTIQRFIREGKIPAHKIGRIWRISRESLEEFAGMSLGEKPSLVERSIRVSVVVEIREGESEEVSRISNTLIAMLNCKDPSWGESSYELIYHQDEKRARFILNGSLRFIAAVMELFQMLESQT